MHSLPQFTRSTRWGEFAGVGADIFEGNFMVSEQFSGRTVFLGGNCPRGNLPRGQFSSGAIILVGNCRWGNFPWRQLSGHLQSRYLWSVILKFSQKCPNSLILVHCQFNSYFTLITKEKLFFNLRFLLSLNERVEPWKLLSNLPS